jgi:RHS repeat-associated protein
MNLLRLVRASLAAAALAGGAVAVQLATPTAAFAQAAPSAFTSATRYDAMHRVTGTIAPDPDGTGPLHYAAVRNTYDAAGRLIRVEKGELASWQSEATAPSAWTGFTILQTLDTVYDSQSRKVKETLSGGGAVQTVTQYSYDSLGNLECTAVRMNPAVFGSLPASACAQSSGGQDRITKNLYDAAGDLIQVREGVGTSLEKADATYSYTLTGKREYVIDGNGNRAQLTYDGHDRLAQWIFPSTTRPSAYNDSTQATALSTAGAVNTADFEQYAYDLQGNRTSLRKRDARTIVYIYDALNRLIHKGGQTGDVFYTYDAEGHQLTAKYATGGQGITNSYDGFGELASAMSDMGGTARTLSYLYDADGNRIRITHPDGVYFTSAYDGLDRINAASWTNGAGTTSFLSVGYDNAGRRSTMNRGTGAVSGTDYLYDAASRLTSLAQRFAGTSANLTETFGYNPASQIATETRSNDAYAWNGAVAADRPYTTNGLNQYTAAGPASFSYDANGNLTSDGSNSYGYDAENRLVSASGAHSAALSYDPLGRLWQVSSPSGTTQFLYDGDHVALEYNNSGGIAWRYFFGPGADEPIIADQGGMLDCNNTRFLHLDHQGSMIATNDCLGNRATVATYDEYGIPASTNWGRFQYTGQAWIAEVGMYYYKARIYSPTLGRFMQTDPVGYDGGINIYAYVGNDPVNRTDPDGLRWLTDGERQMAKNLGLSLPLFHLMSIPKRVMDIGNAAATTFPYEIDFSSEYFRNDFSSGTKQDRSLLYHEFFHLFQNKNWIAPWTVQAARQLVGAVDYQWNPKLSWQKQNFEAQAEAFGQCAGAGHGCGRLQGQSIGGGGSRLSFKNGTFTLSTEVTGSHIRQVTTFKAPVKNDDVETIQ